MLLHTIRLQSPTFIPNTATTIPATTAPARGMAMSMPTNSPYMVISQRFVRQRSGFSQRLRRDSGRFPPRGRNKSSSPEGAMAPTLQMIFRRSNKQTPDLNAYFTGIADPTVFEGKRSIRCG